MKSNGAHPLVDSSPVDTSSQAGLQGLPNGEANPTPLGDFAELEALRLPSNFGAAFGVRKVLSRVPVGKPKNKFFRIHAGDDWVYRALIYIDEGDVYLVAHDVYSSMDAGPFRAVQLHVGMDQNDQPFVLPVVLPDETGYRHAWHESLAHAVECATQRWVRINAKKSISGYEIIEAEGQRPEPTWNHAINELIDVAFRGRRILTLDHPVIRALKGSV